jgi:DNA-binding Xre family transcriptional regulator
MIVINVKQLCKLRGIKHPHVALKKAGISHYIASEYLSGKKSTFVTGHIEKLCKLLRCTPNDLFKWVPDQAADDYAENPLQAIRQQPTFDLEDKLKTMSLDEIKKKFEQP